MKKQTPWKMLDCSFRELIKYLTPTELTVWIYYYLHTGKDNTAYLSLKLLITETGLSRNTIKAVRRSLIKKGWFVVVEKSEWDPKEKKNTVPRILLVIPESLGGQNVSIGRGSKCQNLTPDCQNLTVVAGSKCQKLGSEVDVKTEVYKEEVDRAKILPATGKSIGQTARQVFAWWAKTYPGASYADKDKKRLTEIFREEGCSLPEAKIAISAILGDLHPFYNGQAGDRVVAGFVGQLDAYREAVRAEARLKAQMAIERAKAQAQAAEEAEAVRIRAEAEEEEARTAREFLEQSEPSGIRTEKEAA